MALLLSPKASAASSVTRAATNMSHRTSSSATGNHFLDRIDSQAEMEVLSKSEMDGSRALARRAWRTAQVAALLAASAARVRRQAELEDETPFRTLWPLSVPDGVLEKKGAGMDRRVDRLSEKQREARRVEQQVQDDVRRTRRAASLRAMVRLAHPLNRPVLKDVLAISDDEFERACQGRDFAWEGPLAGGDDFCCVCTAGLSDVAEASSSPSRLSAEHGDVLAMPAKPDLRYGSGYEPPQPNRYQRLLQRNGRQRQPLDDRLLELCTQLVERLQDLSLTGTTNLEVPRLCQLLTVEKAEGPNVAIDVQEMCTVPHETALRAYALHRSQREAVLRAMRRDARAVGRPPARAVHHNVAFQRCVPRGDAAYCKVPRVLRLEVKQPPDLVSFDRVWRPHMLSLRITKRFCQLLDHSLVPRPDALVRAGLLRPLDRGMLPAAPPCLKKVQRPLPVPFR